MTSFCKVLFLDSVNIIIFLYCHLILLGRTGCNYSFLRLLYIMYVAELVMVVWLYTEAGEFFLSCLVGHVTALFPLLYASL